MEITDNYLKLLREYAKENMIPIVREKTAELLYDFIKERKPKNILEIGTAIGFSGLLMLSATENSTLTTIEKDKKMYDEAVENFRAGMVSDRVNLIFGDAGEVLPTLNEKYDFILLDGPKGQYKRYLPYLLNLSNKNGMLFADDVLYHGMVMEQVEVIRKKHRTIVVNMREFIKEICENENLESNILDIEDGVAIAIKKS